MKFSWHQWACTEIIIKESSQENIPDRNTDMQEGMKNAKKTNVNEQ